MQKPIIDHFCQYLLEISEFEQEVEKARQMLSMINEFEPYSAFQRIDKYRKGCLSSFEIFDFLMDNDLNFTQKQCESFIEQYDIDFDNNLSYKEYINILSNFFFRFLIAILPTRNSILRTTVSQRPTVDFSSKKLLKFEVEFGISRLISKEISGIHSLNHFKSDFMFKFPGFNSKDLFSLIDRENKSFINFDDMKTFLENNQYVLNNEQITSIIKRLDRNGDAKIHPAEFQFILYDEKIVLSSPSKNPDPCSPYKKADKLPNSTKKSKGIEDNELFQTERKKYLSKFSANSTYTGHIKLDKVQNLNSSNSCCRKHAKPKNFKTLLCNDEQKEVALTLKEIVNMDLELEVYKRDLAYREDFSLLNLFKTIDYKAKGYFTGFELGELLNKIGLFPQKYEIYLFFKRYDRDNDGKLSYNDLLDCLIPDDLKKVVELRNTKADWLMEDIKNVIIKIIYYMK